MLRLIYGGFGCGKSTRVFELLGKDAESAREYKKNIYLIVPEQDTVRAELESAQKLPPHSPLVLEVTNFSRLSDSVFRSFGGLCYNYADTQAKALCMWQTIRSLGGLISEPMTEVDDVRVGSMLSLITELRCAGISSSDLESASKALGEDSPLGRELSDIALIEGVYRAKLSETYSDGELDLERACEILEPQLRFIRRLLSDARSVTVTMPYDRTRGKYLYTADIERTERAICSYAEDMGIEILREDVSSAMRSGREDVRYVSENFYLKGAKAYSGDVENIAFFEAADVREEAEFVSAEIKKRIIEGARFRDIAVVARNAREYAGILDASFDRHGIPSFFSCEVSPESHPIVKMIYGALSLYTRTCRSEDVISYLKCGLTGISDDDIDLYEKYVNSWKINGKRLISDTPFTNNPGGYTDKTSAEYTFILERANHVREALRAQLVPFFDSVSGERSICEMTRAVWELCEGMKISDKLSREACACADEGDEQSARESEGIYRCLCDTLDTLCDTVGDETVDAGDYLRLLRLALSGKSVSVIPTSADAVTVGSANMLRTSGIKHVFIIGAAEGSFPVAIKDTGYFDNVKKAKLAGVGIDLRSDIYTEVSRELFYFARAVCCASESVSVSYSVRDTQGSTAKVSGAVISLMKLLASDKIRKISEMDVCERIYDAQSLFELALVSEPESADGKIQALIELSRDGAVEPYELERVLPKDLTTQLFGDKLRMSYSRFESYVRCHFSYLCKYILKLEQTKKYDFEAVDIGNFVHDILDKLTGELTSDGKFRVTLTREELDTRVSAIAREYLERVLPEKDASSTRLMRVIDRIRRSVSLISENICREFEQSSFTPIGHEMKICEDSPFNPSPIEFTVEEGVTLSIGGTLDRADAYRRDGDVYVRVIDYKTGSKDFSLEDVKVGLNLQMLIYLFTLCSQKGEKFREMLGCSPEGRILPAGVLYYSASVADIQENTPVRREDALERAQSTLARRGLLTNDESILRAMEQDLGGRYIPVKEGKDGIKAKGKSLTLIDQDDFAVVREETERVICEVARELIEGHIEALPLEYKGDVKCRYCEMRAVCRAFDRDNDA